MSDQNIDLPRAFAAVERIADALETISSSIADYVKNEETMILRENESFNNLIQLLNTGMIAASDSSSSSNKVNPFEPYSDPSEKTF